MCKRDFSPQRLPAPNRVLHSSFGQGNVGSACFLWKEKNHRSCLPSSPPWRPDFFRMSGHLLLLVKEGRCCCFSSIPSFSSPLLLAPFACAQSHAISEKSHSETARGERRKKVWPSLRAREAAAHKSFSPRLYMPRRLSLFFTREVEIFFSGKEPTKQCRGLLFNGPPPSLPHPL